MADEEIKGEEETPGEPPAIPIITTDTPTQTTTMEVHKHPHHVTHKKKLGEYLLEFFMLFLAVFLGFIAENIRETSAERHREHEYMQSLFNDLKSDTTKLGNNLKQYKVQLLAQDTLLKTCMLLDKGYNVIFYRNHFSISGFPDFGYTDATIQQLKNSGGFRLITDQKTVNKIMAYDAEVKSALGDENMMGNSFIKLLDYETELLNNQPLYEQSKLGKSAQQMEDNKFDVLLTHDKAALSKLWNKIFYCRSATFAVNAFMTHLKASATTLMEHLKKEYHLQD
jgi:hypothetical protein